MKFALCIGINDYPGTDRDLFGCVNDAEDWAEALGRRGFQCHTLLNDEATGRAIREGMRRLAELAGQGDIVVVVFAGHGSVVPDENADESDGLDECWCPHDVTANGVITDDELHAVYETRKQGVRWILISDSCNSGTVSRRSALDSVAPEAAAEPHAVSSRFLPPNLCSARMAAVAPSAGVTRFRGGAPGRRGPMLLAGCKEDQESMDAWFGGRPNGAFTYAALKALDEIGPDADYEAWMGRIGHYLPSQRFPQEPTLFDAANNRKRWRVLAAEREATPAATARPGGVRRATSGAAMIGEGLAAQSLGQMTSRRARARSGQQHLIAEGDSWFSIPVFTDLIDELENDHGFDITNVAHHGHTLESMAFAFAQKNDFTRQFKKMVDRDEKPSAVLLSGGGNDIAGEQFRLLINPAAGPRRGANRAIIDELVHGRLREAYVALISAINYLSRSELGREVPVLLHGYAYAVPDGRGFGWITVAGPWLQPAFVSQGYSDLDERREITDLIIDEFNVMLEGLAQSPEFSNVHHNDFRPILPREGDHRVWWNDELHPTPKGFRRVAKHLANKIKSLV